MRNKRVDVADFDAIAFSSFSQTSSCLRTANLNTALRPGERSAFSCPRFMTGRIQVRRRHRERTSAGAIDFVDEIDDTDRIIFRRFRVTACPIAKDHASGPVGVVDDGRHYVGPITMTFL